MEIGKKLKRLRLECGMRQGEVARLSGIGRKTISSFETGDRVDGMRIEQLQRILSVYGVSVAEFFSDGAADLRADRGPDRRAVSLMRRLNSMSTSVQEALLSKMQLMVDTADEVQALSRPRPYAGEHQDWQMLNSHN